MPEIKIHEIPAKIREVKKDEKKKEEKQGIDVDSLEALVQQLRARSTAQQMHTANKPVAPVLRQTNLAQETARTDVIKAETRETADRAEHRAVVYETENGRKTIYESKSKSPERAYQSQNSERKYSTSEKNPKEEPRRASPVLGPQNQNMFDSRQPFGMPQDNNRIRPFEAGHEDRDYEVNPLAEGNDRKKSRRL